MVATPKLNSSEATYSPCYLSINFHMYLLGKYKGLGIVQCAQTLLGVLGHSFLKIPNSGKEKKAKSSDHKDFS